jgi:hypothetical protein
MIPRILHFCFGLSPDFGGKPWSLVHYACIRSAVERLKPEKAIMHCQYEPSGPWWDLTRPYLNVNKVVAPQEVFGNRLHHFAHRADVLRLTTLIEHGGIYLDCDVFVHRDFDDLLGHPVVMGFEGRGEAEVGLCNGVILAEKGAPFLQRWFEGYRSFRSKGHDTFWVEHSVELPRKLMREHPEDVVALPYNAFHWPTCIELPLLFEAGHGVDPKGLYANHLWETIAWWHYLKDHNPGRVRRTESPFNLWVRDYVKELPDLYGVPSMPAMLLDRARRILRRAAAGG